MQAITISILSIFVSASAWALPSIGTQTVRGTIKWLGPGPSPELRLLTTPAGTPLKVNSPYSLILMQLETLKDGDYVVASGTLNSRGDQVEVQAIQRVGLKKLLGAWRSPSWEIFRFIDFNRLALYKTTQQKSPVRLAKAREYSYVLAPEAENQYSIFLSDEREVHVGSLSLENDILELKVFDSKTGLASEKISLSPLPIQ